MGENDDAALNSGGTPDDQGSGKDGASFDPGAGKDGDAGDLLDNIYFGDEGDEDEAGGPAPDDKEGDGGKKGGNGKDGKKDDGVPDVQQLMAEIEKLKADKANLNKALHEERQGKKKAKSDDAEEELSDAQLKELMKEHHDDPSVLFNIVQYMARKIAKGEKKAAVNESEIIAKKRDLDNFIAQRHPDYGDPESELRRRAEDIKGKLDLGDHPYGDFLALASNAYIAMPDIVKQAYEKGKADAVKDALNANQKKDVKDSQLTPKGGTKAQSAAIPKDIASVAKQMNMSPSQAKIYARLVGSNSKGGSITVEG